MALRVLAAFVLALAAFAGRPSEPQARMHPYYVVRGVGYHMVKPRILFVLDTSASMSQRAQAAAAQCAWNKCEDGDGTEQSRIHAARSAIHEVIAATHDAATFGLMTFDKLRAPQGAVPKMCNTYGYNHRFMWATEYSFFSWDWISQFAGYKGVWRLCDDLNRPYPYLRWDNLGVGSVITDNGETGQMPPSPLISTAYSDNYTKHNATRKVQWFPRFMGIRVNLNAQTDPDKEILAGTIGDWASTDADRAAKVWGQDFYYWPYVDGFPGYSAFEASPSQNKTDYLGVAEEDTSAASAELFGPFYMDLSPSDLNPNYWGPGSHEEAQGLVMAHTSPLVEGGVDVSGGTPWGSVIGPIPAAPLKNNAIFSHSTVSSYLKFSTTAEALDVCAPTVAVIITDGYPSPENTEGGWKLYDRLAKLRTELNVRTYVVGFFLSGGPLNDMACAAAGACDGNQCDSPCDDTPVQNWDTCKSSNDPENECAWLASSAEELVSVLTTIVESELGMDVDSGPGTTIHDFGVGKEGSLGQQGDKVQTSVRAYTEWPGWKGHVLREVCDDEDPESPGQLAPWCQGEDVFDEVEETFGPCDQSRSWDAGECLKMTQWADRRLYTSTEANKLVRISKSDGTATGAFETELVKLGLISPPNTEEKADEIAAFILGRDWPGGWKLPGLANSSPIVVRRVPKRNPKFIPSVGIRDPHCAGRVIGELEEDALPPSLGAFAEEAWDPTLKLLAPTEHYEYQEAVLIGDDLGVLHAFQLDSGNELWGFLPRFLLETAVRQAEIGAADVGQPTELDDHHYGIAATLNHGWIHDSSTDEWRHVGVIGTGVGGTEFVALELSHMSPVSTKGPFEILWTTEDAALKSDYDRYAGETWARPAIVYQVLENLLENPPKSFLLMGTGYASEPATSTEQGRALMLAETLTGKLVDVATLPTVTTPVYEPAFGTVVDPAVGTHCASRYWAEMQEAYIVDPAGRLFRWDQGHLADPTEEHEADSGSKWNGYASQVIRFPACQGDGDTCTVGSSNKGDVFLYAPAVSSNDRIDDPDGISSGIISEASRDRFLVALVSGSPNDDTIDGSDASVDFHSSLYILADDHRKDADKHGGFDIPSGAPKMFPADVGSHPRYLRLALSDIERTREYTPFEGSPTYTETRRFLPGTRPIRAPRILVRGVYDGETPLPDIEVYEVSFLVYEPPRLECDPLFYDEDEQTWHFDYGSTYTISFRLSASSTSGFDFNKGAAVAGLGGLQLTGVEQVMVDGGVSGPKVMNPSLPSCDPNDANAGEAARVSVPVTYTEIVGFTPIETAP